MPLDLFDMEFDEISLVPSGDNPRAKIVMSKADPELLTLGKGDGMCRTCGKSKKDCKCVSKDEPVMDGPTQNPGDPSLADLLIAINSWNHLFLSIAGKH